MTFSGRVLSLRDDTATPRGKRPARPARPAGARARGNGNGRRLFVPNTDLLENKARSPSCRAPRRAPRRAARRGGRAAARLERGRVWRYTKLGQRVVQAIRAPVEKIGEGVLAGLMVPSCGAVPRGPCRCASWVTVKVRPADAQP